LIFKSFAKKTLDNVLKHRLCIETGKAVTALCKEEIPHLG